MIHFKFSNVDKRYLFLKGDTEADYKIFKKLKDHINLIDPICYLPKFTGIPYTQDFIWDYVQPTGEKILYCSIGLWQVIYKYLKSNNIEFDGLIENKNVFKRELKHSFDEFRLIVDSWHLSRNPRPYQYESAYKILQYNQSVSQLATRAGKTLIAYIIFRYCIEYLNAKRILMIVPSIDLVKQGYNDFNEYAEFFKTECIWGGGKLVESANITIGTFQSLIKFLDKKNKKYNPSFFDGYDIVFCDETHRATASQIKTIISQPFMKDVKIAFGMTGTLPKEKTIEHYCLHSLLGAKIQEISPRELMDAGYISDICINQVRLNYETTEEIKDLFIKCAEYSLSEYVMQPNPKNPLRKQKVKLDNPKFLIQHQKILPDGIYDVKYKLQQDILYKSKYIKVLRDFIKASDSSNMLMIEKMMSHFIDKRIEYLCDKILPKCNNNTLILAHHTEYIKYFAEIIKQKFPNRHIDVITGSVSGKRRDEIKNMLKENNDCILIASYGVMSTGITLSNLCFGVLFESFKSNIINMQSLGRGLGLSELKDKYIVYDIIDCYDTSISTKAIYRQGTEKIKTYKENKYEYKIINETL